MVAHLHRVITEVRMDKQFNLDHNTIHAHTIIPMLRTSARRMWSLSIQSSVKLASGYSIPRLGFGVYQLPSEQTEECVKESLAAGYRHIDSAVAYRNQGPCGRGILNAKPSIPRSEIFYTSKVRSKSMSYESAREQVDSTIAETGLEYIDLMLLHAPYGGPQARKGAWKALVEAVEEGKVRSIGVSNYGVHHLDELEKHIEELAAERGGPGKGGIVSVGQWEVHPWLQRKDIVEWANERGIVVEAYSPLVRGQRWGEKSLQELSQKYGKTAAQILVRWSLQKGYVPLPKTETLSRIHENAAVFDFEISEEDMTKLESDEYSPCTWDPTTSSLQT